MTSFFQRPGLRNLAALAVIQGSNALVPIIVVPFVLYMVGAQAYAPVAVAEAVSALVLAGVLYSFDVDAVARVVQHSETSHPRALGTILSEVLAARLALFAVLAPLSLALFYLAGGERVELLALWLMVPLGHIFHSYWLHQANEANLPAAGATLGSRAVTLAIVFAFIRGPDDVYLLPLAVGIPFIVSGMLSLAWYVHHNRVRLQPVAPARIGELLWAGKEICAGNFSVALYRDSNVIILGAVGAPASAVSAYSLAEKLVKTVQALARPLNQFYFPKVLRALAAWKRPDRAAARCVANYTLPQLAANLALVVILIGGAAAFELMPIAAEGAQDFLTGAELALVMSPVMLIGVANYMFGTAGLNALGEQRQLFVSILLTGVASVILCAMFSLQWSAFGAAVTFVLAEAVLCGLVLFRYRHASPYGSARAHPYDEGRGPPYRNPKT